MGARQMWLPRYYFLEVVRRNLGITGASAGGDGLKTRTAGLCWMPKSMVICVAQKSVQSPSVCNFRPEMCQRLREISRASPKSRLLIVIVMTQHWKSFWISVSALTPKSKMCLGIFTCKLSPQCPSLPSYQPSTHIYPKEPHRNRHV